MTVTVEIPAILEAAQKSVPKDNRNADTLMAQVRELVAQEPSREAFLELCLLIEHASLFEPDQVAEVWVPYLVEQLASWDSSLRAAPAVWIDMLTYGALPLEVLHVVSALGITSMMIAHFDENPDYERLLRWFRSLPEDCPTVEGFSMSFDSYDFFYAWESQENDKAKKRSHRKAFAPTEERHQSRSLTYYYDPDDLEVLLGAPIWREVKYFDGSTGSSYYGPHQSQYDALDGRELTIAQVLQYLPSSQLEAINLTGCVTSLTSLGVKGKHPTIKRLALGGIFPPTDEVLVELARAFPSLVALDFQNGVVGAVYEEGFDFDDYDYDGSVWRMDASDVSKHLVTQKGIKALMSLKQLELYVGLRDCADEEADLLYETFKAAVEALQPSFDVERWGNVATWSDWYKN